jgi:hypothetical protein
LYQVSRACEGGGNAAEPQGDRAHVNVCSIGGDEKNSYCILPLASLPASVRESAFES